MDIAIIVGLLIVVALLGSPLFAIFGAAAMLLFSEAENGSFRYAVGGVFDRRFGDSDLLATLPLFVFAGYVLAESKTPMRLVRVTRALFGWLPGGVAVVCLLASAFFTTFTGGSGITIVAIGGLLYPALQEEKFGERFSLGLVTTGGSLGLLFPPSIPIILYAIVAGLLIDKLFLAGFIPGLISVAILVVYAIVVGIRSAKNQEINRLRLVLQFARFCAVLVVVAGTLIAIVAFVSQSQYGDVQTLLANHEGKGIVSFGIQTVIIVVALLAATFATSGETRSALLGAFWEIVLPFVLLSGLLTGALRLHEAAAFTALYVLAIEVLIYRDIGLRRDLPRIIRTSMTMLGAILAILATALGFTDYLIQQHIPEDLVRLLDEHVSSPLMFLLLLNVFLLIVGMLMDIFSAIVVVVPLLIPIAAHYDIDPYHLGIVFLLNLEIGYLTPPVGLNLFISSFRFEKPVTLLYKSVLPFILLLVIAVLLTTYVPVLSTWLTQYSKSEEITPADFRDPELPDAEPLIEGDEAPPNEMLDDLLEEEGELDL